MNTPTFVGRPAEAEAAPLPVSVCMSVPVTFWGCSDELINRLGINNGGFVRMVYADAWFSKLGMSSQPCRRKRRAALFEAEGNI